jgi:hypothetical protein
MSEFVRNTAHGPLYTDRRGDGKWCASIRNCCPQGAVRGAKNHTSYYLHASERDAIEALEGRMQDYGAIGKGDKL